MDIFDVEVEHDDSSDSVFRWWKSIVRNDEVAGLQLDLSSISTMSPRQKVMRELERLAIVAPEGLDDLRYKLASYRAGDLWVPTGGMNKEGMDIPPMITIALVGFSGSGKSSLVNLMYSVLGRGGGFVPFANASSGSSSEMMTKLMEEHNVLRSLRSGFCVYDTRGFDYDNVGETLDVVSQWMTEGIHHNQLCWRSGDDATRMNEVDMQMLRSSSKFVRRSITCVLVIVNIAEIHKALLYNDPSPLEATRELFSAPSLRKGNDNPMLILTHGDKLTAEDRLNTRLKICQFLGISEVSGVYDIVCLSEHGVLAEKSDPVTAYSLVEAVYRALLISDRSHLPRENWKDKALLLLSWLFWLIGALCALLSRVFSSLSHRMT